MRIIPHHLQPEDYNDDAADLRDQRAVLIQQASKGAGRQTQDDEHEAESENERDGMSQRLRPRGRRCLGS
jgi:hypothetical protein